ncbi:peptidase M15 [Pseudomonas putida]|uniref:Peptidase M15 n=1 Tax=Pseudomonas putida TaxID=303 RepID=A0A7W2L197_PSEPU|nr:MULTISPECIES: D-Ala-D-Ala carboxypeptidase family metallohydrolase [Pseudomonas]MBA6116467.1 peptidase M15 [Pseudomonas putida]MBI6944935.1 peptidase M15 [Pseudomonas putida]MBI6961239.1 peptidase M15 [Pseudomonas putida]MCZ9636762.1 D-Ala-D-Ala carboxypeptidase family metallohydrolase [Pseudomonas putida]MEC4876258.1 D-Ala-D-Ala carboxypeptidase family metallohydrolase [Pseudomonas sp. NC26]
MRITPHFTLQEMIVSQIASREGLINTPTPQVITNLHLLCQALEQVRALFARPVIVSSGYRSAELNARIGGSSRSQHMTGLAADFGVVGISHREVVHRISKSNVEFDQLILEFDSWVHLSVSPSAPRREVLTIRRGTGYMSGLK